MPAFETQVAGRIAAAQAAAAKLPPDYRLNKLRWHWPTGWVRLNGSVSGSGDASIEFRHGKPPRVEATLDVVVAEDLPWATLRLRLLASGIRMEAKPAPPLEGEQRIKALAAFTAEAPPRLARYFRVPEPLVRYFCAKAAEDAQVRRCGRTGFLIRLAGSLAGVSREITFRYERSQSSIAIVNAAMLDRLLADWIAGLPSRVGRK